MKLDSRVAGIILVAVIVIALLDQTTTFRILSTIQYLVVIVTGITLTLYLWKRM